MELIVFDVEATGLSAKDEVVQFAGLLLGMDLKVKKVINFYCYTQASMHHKAKLVTGLDMGKVYELSKGKYFEDYYYSLDLFKKKDLIWVGYNSIAYDTRVINQTLQNNGLPYHNFGSQIVAVNKTEGNWQLDMMRVIQNSNGGIAMPLTKATETLDYNSAQLEQMYSKFLKLLKMNTSKKAHNALYDAMVTWLLLIKYKGICVDGL